jgi:hypothetical protein
MITGGSSTDFDTKRQKRDHYRSINHVAITGPVVQTKWSHIPLTFDTRDVDLRSAPHSDAMVINCSMAGWDLHKVLVDNGSQADIIDWPPSTDSSPDPLSEVSLSSKLSVAQKTSLGDQSRQRPSPH